MFGEYLKKYRIANEMTQSQAATKLNLIGEDLSNIDTVTLSRWERGTTKPTLSRSIRVLREFTNDLEPYLSEISYLHQQEITSKNRVEHFDILMEEKYHSLNNLIAKANYQSSSMSEHNAICECPIVNPNDNDTVNSVLHFHEQTSADYMKHGLSRIDLLSYCSQKRFIAYKYVDSITGKLLGHNIGTIFTPEGISSEIETLDQKSIDEIDLRKTVPYNQNRLTYGFDYKCMLVSQYINLIRYSNVQRYYFFNALPESGQILEQLGFVKVAFDTESEIGGFKLGNRAFEHCLYEIDTATLLSHPEIITLIKTTKWNNQNLNQSN